MEDFYIKPLTAAGFNPERVLSYRPVDGGLSIIYNNGIKGCPKMFVPVKGLPSDDELEAAPLVDVPDVSAMTVAQIESLQLSPAQWELILEAEQSGKNRKTVIEYATQKIGD